MARCLPRIASTVCWRRAFGAGMTAFTALSVGRCASTDSSSPSPGVESCDLSLFDRGGRRVHATGSEQFGPGGKSATEQLRGVVVIDAETGDKVPMQELWRTRPVVLTVIRRFGCPICREWATDLSALKPELERLGVDLVAVGHEREGVEEFQRLKFFKGRVLYDDQDRLCKQLHLPKLGLLDGFGLLSWETHRVFRRARQRSFEGDFKGDGRQLGATFAVLPGGEVILDHRQENMGDHANPTEILDVLHRRLGHDKEKPANAAKE